MLFKIGKKLFEPSGRPALSRIRARFLLREMRTAVRSKHEISSDSPLETLISKPEQGLVAYLRAILRDDDVAETEGQLLKAIFKYALQGFQRNVKHPDAHSEFEDLALQIAYSIFAGLPTLFIHRLGSPPRHCEGRKRRTPCRLHTAIGRQVKFKKIDNLRQIKARKEVSITKPEAYETSSSRDIPASFDGKYSRVDNSARQNITSQTASGERGDEKQAGICENYDDSEHATVTGTAPNPAYDWARKDAEIQALTPFAIDETAAWYQAISSKVAIKHGKLLKLLLSGMSVKEIYKQLKPWPQTFDAFKMSVSRLTKQWDEEFNFCAFLEAARTGSTELMAAAIADVEHPEQRENRRRSKLQITEEIIRQERFYFPNVDSSGLQERFKQRTAEAPTRCEHGVLTSWLKEVNERIERVVLTHVYCDLCQSEPPKELARAA